MGNSYYKKKAIGQCYDCLKPAAENHRYCTEHLEKRNKRARTEYGPKRTEYRKATRQEIFNKILAAYGGKCACPPCGEINPLFLTLDHKNGDGNKHRAEVGENSLEIYRNVIAAGFPDTFQLLCWNCNCGRARNGGVCPHLNS